MVMRRWWWKRKVWTIWGFTCSVRMYKGICQTEYLTMSCFEGGQEYFTARGIMFLSFAHLKCFWLFLRFDATVSWERRKHVLLFYLLSEKEDVIFNTFCRRLLFELIIIVLMGMMSLSRTPKGDGWLLFLFQWSFFLATGKVLHKWSGNFQIFSGCIEVNGVDYAIEAMAGKDERFFL